MGTSEKFLLLITALFLLLCLSLSFLRSGSVGISGTAFQAYAVAEGDPRPLSIAEKLNAVLGIAGETGNTDGVNINTASAEDLRMLPGIGEVLAARIIRYRTYNGDFQDKAHITDVTGIGSGLYDKIRDLIRVG